MASAHSKTVTVVGGGLAGLINALLLNRAGFEVTLVERKHYPFHRVCGEYISNEVLPFLSSLAIDIKTFEPSNITQLAVSSVSGRMFNSKLDLGGFGLSRFTLDNFLHEKAKTEGVKFLLGVKVNSISLRDGWFEVNLSDNTTIESAYVIAAHGKRSNLDKHRDFFTKRSPYLGVKYHVRIDFPIDLVQLDNFEGGYCGTVKIEKDRYNLCYLSQNHHLKTFGSIEAMEEEILFKNPILKDRFANADFLNEKPEVINEISFQRKPLVEDHVFYCGDSAGMISPLCGNGMAMAIHSAKVLAESISQYHPHRDSIEKAYTIRWKQLFENRLLAGRLSQKLFGHNTLTDLALKCLILIPGFSHHLVKRTHGKPF
jgi:menaquinone-9 beta-reductase